MKPNAAPFPNNEIGRIIALAELNLDYLNMDDTFKDLTKLAAKITGTPLSMINIIDNYTVWTVSGYGFETQQTPREESVCQYTILEKEEFVVNDLSENPNFMNADFVTKDPHFRFYHGVPINADSHNLGALCVMDMTPRSLSAEKVEMLKIIADEITNRLKTIHYIESLKGKITEVKDTQNKVVHDIRGPIAGIMGLADIISQQGHDNNIDEVLDFINLIYKGGKSVLELADDILKEAKTPNKTINPQSATAALQALKKRFEQLYTPQARSKNIELKVIVKDNEEEVQLPQNKLMQIAGNLISNAIKFTPRFGDVTVVMEINNISNKLNLQITVKNTGEGISKEQIASLMADSEVSADGTEGEKGYGFGLTLVKHLVKGLNGTFNIVSEQNAGSEFIVGLPLGK